MASICYSFQDLYLILLMSTQILYITDLLRIYSKEELLQDLSMSKQTILYLTLLATALVGTIYLTASHQSSEFQMWKLKYGAVYGEAENLYRRAIFQRNRQIIKAHNSDESRTYDMGINKFSALTDQQFASIYLSPKPYDPQWEKVDTTFVKVGADVDWTAKGMVTPVKDQGNCGSCWAFSAVATIESMSLMKGKSVLLSQQQLVDCSRKYGNFGCSGGQNYQGLDYVKDHGITTQALYPYKGHNENCRLDGGDFKISSVQSAKGCPGIQTAVTSRPIGLSADATNWSKYSSGIFHNCSTSLNHNILLVGFTDSYWKIKNSWGKDWGENGYIRLAPGNTCGVCQDKSPWPQ